MIKQVTRSFRQQDSGQVNTPKVQEDPFFQQQGLMFCSRFPDQPLRPNTLMLGEVCQSDEHQTDRLNASPIALGGAQPETLSLSSPDAFWYRLTGHAKGHYSLAIVNRALASALYRKSNAQARFVPFDDGLKKSVQHMPEDTEPTLKQAISNLVPSTTDRYDNNDLSHQPNFPIVSIVHHYPVIIDEEPADIRLIIFFWEESRVPAETVSILNQKFDAILVATSFVATVLRNSGCAIPIFVIPMGVDHVADYARPLSPLPPIHEGERFRFLHISSVFERKGPEFLLAAYIAQFNAQDPVELYIKTFPNPHNRIHEQLAHFASTKPNPPRVIIDEAEVSSEALQTLYRSAHTLVLPTRGEGFNLPAAEALALGLPVIVTGFGAQTDFCSAATASLIPFRFDVSHSHLNQGDGYWVTPDVRALAQLMQQAVDEVHNGNADPLNQRRVAGQALMRTTYTWDQAAQGVSNAVHWLTAQRTIHYDVSLKHLTVATDADINTFAMEIPHEDALIITLKSHLLERLLLNNVPTSVFDAIATLTQRGKILILELPFALNDAKLNQPIGSEFESQLKSPLDVQLVKAFFKHFDRIIVQSVNDLNQLLPFCEPRTVMTLPNHPSAQQDQNIQAARNSRLTNMVKGLKYDQLYDTLITSSTTVCDHK